MSDIIVLRDTSPVIVDVEGMGAPGPTGPAGDVARSATRAELAAITGATAGASRLLSEAGREGIFIASTDAGDATKATTDTAGGIYVAGVGVTWVRKFSGPVNPLWFGIVDGNAAGANGAANSTALTAMFAVLRTRAANTSTFYQGLEPVLFPPGYFEFASTIDITDGTLIFAGAGTGQTGGIPTLLKFPAATTGIRIQDYNTSGGTGTRANAKSAAGSIIRNFSIDGTLAGSPVTEGETHGVQLRTRATVEHCRIGSFAGNGIHIAASIGGGSDEGNANNFQLNHNTVNACRTGLYVDGADANAGIVNGGDYSSNRQWGVWDSSFLGNTYVAVHTASNGWDGAQASTPTGSTIGGSRYYVKTGQASGASTNAPKSSTVTITIASPGVVSWTSHGLTAGQQVTFSTTGALPTGLTAATAYYVVNPGANDFQVSLTSGGAAINTSGTQSGTHTSGAGVDNTWWGWTGAGGVYNGIVAWVTATTFREGGAYHTDDGNNRCVFVGCYSEGDQNASQFVASTVVIGGLQAANLDEYPGYISSTTGGALVLTGIFNATSPIASNQAVMMIGSAGADQTIRATGAASRLILEQTGGTSGTSRIIVSNESAQNGLTIEQTHATTQLCDLRFLTTAAGAHGLRYERRVGAFLDAANLTWEMQFGTLGSGVAVIGDAGVKITGTVTASGVATASAYKVGANQVVGARGTAIADATDAGTAITQLNLLLAAARTHGLIAT